MLDRLPYYLLQSLPGYIDTLADFRSLILTSSIFYASCGSPTPQQLLRLATNPETDIQPYPHLLLAVKARALSTHSIQTAENLADLHNAIRKGPEAVLNLALKTSPLRKEDLQNLHDARQVINELANILEPECGPSSEENDMLTVCNNVSLALTNYWIYCELFSETIEAQYRTPRPTASVVHLPSANMRLNWFVFCVPDENSRHLRGHPYVDDNDPSFDRENSQHQEDYDIDSDHDEEHVVVAVDDRREYQALDLTCLPLSDRFESILDKISPLPHALGGQTANARNIAMHLGIDSLRLLLPGAEDGPIPNSVREVIEAGERGEVKSPSSWMDNWWWHSFQRDLMEAWA